jgi:hypothetical protein
MTRTQIQLPDPLYRELKRIAEQQDWSLAEVVRRAGELYVGRYPERNQSRWEFPKPLDLGGDFLCPPQSICSEAEAIAEKIQT